MNLTKLKWTKNVNHQDDKSWAYQNIEPNLKIFLLGWKNEPSTIQMLVSHQKANLYF